MDVPPEDFLQTVAIAVAVAFLMFGAGGFLTFRFWKRLEAESRGEQTKSPIGALIVALTVIFAACLVLIFLAQRE